MMEQHEINERIKRKIEKSILDDEIKKFLLEIIKFEISEGASENKNNIRFSKFYRENIDATFIKMTSSAS